MRCARRNCLCLRSVHNRKQALKLLFAPPHRHTAFPAPPVPPLLSHLSSGISSPLSSSTPTILVRFLLLIARSSVLLSLSLCPYLSLSVSPYLFSPTYTPTFSLLAQSAGQQRPQEQQPREKNRAHPCPGDNDLVSVVASRDDETVVSRERTKRNDFRREHRGSVEHVRLVGTVGRDYHIRVAVVVHV